MNQAKLTGLLRNVVATKPSLTLYSFSFITIPSLFLGGVFVEEFFLGLGYIYIGNQQLLKLSRLTRVCMYYNAVCVRMEMRARKQLCMS